jgi:hypothetical protein
LLKFLYNFLRISLKLKKNSLNFLTQTFSLFSVAQEQMSGSGAATAP